MTFRKYKWRLYADNNVEKEVVDYLRASGLDVLWVAEEEELRKQQDDMFHYEKAKQLKRYLLTRDEDFWNDVQYPLHASPGVIILAAKDVDIAKNLPRLVRKLLTDYNPRTEPLFLDGVKVRLTAEGITIRYINHDTNHDS